MCPQPIPTEAGCLVVLIQRGEKGPAFSLFAGHAIPVAGVKKPHIYDCTLWMEGRCYTRRAKCDMLNFPAPCLDDLQRWFAENPERWSPVHPVSA